MGPKEQIAAAFGPDKTLYEILGLAKDANPAAIRKAYFKTALTCVSLFGWMSCGVVGASSTPPCLCVLHEWLAGPLPHPPLSNPPTSYTPIHPSTKRQHPDKCQGDPEATAKFQALSVVHATLSDPEKRRLYDETG